MITNSQSGTNIHEIADGIYRINTPVALPGGLGQFNFNQYLIVDDEPMLFHTGPRRLFPLVREAMAHVMPVERLRYVGFSHFEADECGALNELLAVAPRAVPVCGQIAAMVSVDDVRGSRRRARWPTARSSRWAGTDALVRHAAHAARLGLRPDDGATTRTFFCGDLFTQGGAGSRPLTESDILGPSEAFRAPMDYYAHAPRHDGDPRAPRARAADDAGVHARQRLARRRRGIAEGTRREPERAAPIASSGVGSATSCSRSRDRPVLLRRPSDICWRRLRPCADKYRARGCAPWTA